MNACDIDVQPLCAQLKTLHVRECQLNSCLSQDISRSLAHYGPNIRELIDTDPLDVNFITLYRQLALRRIEKFQREIDNRTSYLNRSQVVRKALKIIGRSSALQSDLYVNLDQCGSLLEKEWALQIDTALSNLMHCSNSLQSQLAELMHALEASKPLVQRHRQCVNLDGQA